jgi:streptogramin lyase
MTRAANELTSDEAAVEARRALGVGPKVKATVSRVTRLDREGEAYYLVVLGNDHAAIGVAAVKADNGDIMGSARLAGTQPHLSVDASRAAQIANLGNAAAELVWQPCQASRSPLYPFWRLASGPRSVFVDQQEKCWDRLLPGKA